MKLDFMKYKYVYFLISAFFLLPSFFSLFKWGLKPAIDFTGGSILEIEIKDEKAKLDENRFSQLIKSQDSELIDFQKRSKNNYVLKTKNIDKDKKEKIMAVFNKEFGKTEEKQFQTIGPTIGKELIGKTILSIILAAGFILFYVARRFKDKKYGVCAILAMFHDTFILLGSFSLLGHFYGVEVDTLFVTAILTILSFSIHDTVVVYDRIRESIKIYPQADFKTLVNKAVAETASRSVNNSMTIIFMLLCFYLLGGQTIKWFILALLIGTVSGTYSSTFTAAPLLVLWEEAKERKKRK